MSELESNLECCPKFDPAPWDDKTFSWEGKKFVKDRVRTLFHMPLNFGVVMKRLAEKLEAAEGEFSNWLCLAEHTSRWNMDIFLAVDKDIPDTENTVLSGKFYSRVFEGPYKDADKWTKEFEKEMAEKGINGKRQFYWYTTCPRCAKKYGKNYVVLVSEIEEG